MQVISHRSKSAPGGTREGDIEAGHPACAGEPGCRRGDRPLPWRKARPAALGFIEALEAAYARIGRYPAAGSPRYAHELDLPELRFWPLKNYPYLVFYVERGDHIDVWRVLHAQRDLPAWLSADLKGPNEPA